MISIKRYISVLIFLHLLALLCLLVISAKFGTSVRTVEKNVSTILLTDDGYYRFAGKFAEGGSLLHNNRGPGLPLIYSLIYFFPKQCHP